MEENTWTELVEAGYIPGERLLYLRVPYMRGDDVLFLQRRLDELGFDSGPVDGIFSPELEVAVTEFQRNAGLNVDGIVGETTLDRLRRLHKTSDEGRAGNIPDRMNGYVGKCVLPGLRISIDPAHGGSEHGYEGAGGLCEHDLNLVLAVKLARLLEDHGAETYLTRDGNTAMRLYDRTESANAWAPDIHVCIHHNWGVSSKARGAATYYFANSVYQSSAGRRLAGYVVDALTRELGRVDLHKHGRNYACLREVKPLAVRIEPGFVSHPVEGLTLADPRVIAQEAEAIMHGIEAYLARL